MPQILCSKFFALIIKLNIMQQHKDSGKKGSRMLPKKINDEKDGNGVQKPRSKACIGTNERLPFCVDRASIVVLKREGWQTNFA
jgi:hypothetical protein